jgi:hypothetical protein
MYLIIDELNYSTLKGPEKNAGGKYEGKCHYVIENTSSKNVRNRSCHYIYENNAPRGRLPLYV